MKERLKQELRLVFRTKEQSRGGKRLTCLDMARGIAIILVVIGHSGLVGYSCNVWLSTFHIPTFFVISGILMQIKEEEKRRVPDILLQKAKDIIVPYLWFSLGAVCLDFLQMLLGNFTWDMVWEHIVQTITLQGYSVLWFLPVIYLAEILLFLLCKLSRRLIRRDMCRIVFMVLLVTCCSAGCYYGYQGLLRLSLPTLALGGIRIFVKAVMATVFMSVGYLAGYLCFGKRAASGKLLLLGIGLILSAVNVIAIPRLQIMDFNQLNLSNLWIYYGLGITGGLGCVLVCRGIPNIPLLTFYGQNSLIIMCTHMNFYVMFLSMLINQYVVKLIPGNGAGMYAVLTLTGTMLLSLPVILIFKIFFPFVLGGRKGKV